MLRRTLLLLFFSFLFLSPGIFAQSNGPWPKTLLWRISGNGLEKNSFLYGTMHLQDKRLFYFTDSLYHYLEQAEGYALEIDLREFMDSVIQKAINEKEDEIIDRKRLSRSSERKKIIDSLVQNVVKRKDKASKKELEKIRQEKTKKAIKNREMPTIMDAYLYGIARRQGKWLGGIEDIQDQLSLFDELGGEISSKELLASDDELIKGIEQMISIYLAKDLDKIEEFATGYYSDEIEDKIFLKRNIKMAERMDSLSNIRSMFFTVGAAHLPGDSGVINLLRRKGYRVDPVFSGQTLDPVLYASRLGEMPWVKTTDERKSYEVEMPGKASDLSMFNDFIKMKFYVDVTTLTYFMSGSTVVQQEVDLSEIMKALSKNTDAKILSKKTIEKEGIKGIESVMFSNDNYYRVQYLVGNNMLYMLIAGGDKKETTDAPDVKKFFGSFIANKIAPPQPSSNWSSFSIAEKAFNIKFPATPRHNEKMEKGAENNEWAFTIYDHTDINVNVYYMLQIRETRPGYHLSVDSVVFTQYKENLKEVMPVITRDEQTTFESFPAHRFEGKSEKGDIIYKILTVNRGSRIYNLFCGGANSPVAEKELDRFINSFSLTAYEKSAWKKETDPKNEFYTLAPAAFELEKPDLSVIDTVVSVIDTVRTISEEQTKTEDEDIRYISYNPKDCISYEVYKQKISPYYWIKNDTAFFESMGLQYKAWNDSIETKKWVTNGPLKGMEWVIGSPGKNNRKKFRQLLHGDTLYTLITFIPAQYINDDSHSRFFDEFRLSRPAPPSTIYNSKAFGLLADLSLQDPAQFEKASEAFSSARFGKEDKELLEQALLRSYFDDTPYNYYNTRQKIVNALSDLADSATVDYVRAQFPLLTGDKEFIKFYLLDVLAKYPTSYSFAVLKDLLLNHTPKASTGEQLSYRLIDSLELTRTLFPEVLKLSNNTLFAERLIVIADDLLDSNLVSSNMLIPHLKNFVHTADTILAGLKLKTADDGYYANNYTDLLHLLGHFNTAETNRVLQQYLALDDLTIREEAVLGLLKNNQSVNAKDILAIAADKSYRRSLYDKLNEAGKLSFFPAKYLTQQYLSESDLYVYASDDHEPDKISFIEAKNFLYKGEKKRFYFYKITYPSGEEEGAPEEYLGIAGPYSTDIKKLETDNEATGLFFDEYFDSKKIEKYFTEYLKKLLEP
jgi:uncharacterized protein YbaP (TraB family)